MPAAVSSPDRESGVALVMAIVFMVFGSFAALGLANFASNSLRTTQSVTQQRSIEYAADGATNAAIQSVRYIVGTEGTPTCPPFPSKTKTVTFNKIPINVTCTWAPAAGAATWTVTFKAYTCSSAPPCPGLPVTTATVTYYQTDSSGNPAPGASMSVSNWVVNSAAH